jgi:hypothetical protein
MSFSESQGGQSRRAVTAAVVCLGAACLSAATQPLGAQLGGGLDAEFAVSRDPSQVVVEYSREIGAIEQADPEPTLRVYGDGTFRVHYPRYMKRAGDWQGRLDLEQIDALVRSAVDGRLMEFNAVAVRMERRWRETARREALRAAGEPFLFETSDKEGTRIRLRLERYKPAGVVGAPGLPVDREIVWWDLRTDVQLYPQIEILRALADLESELQALVETPDLERLDPGDG